MSINGTNVEDFSHEDAVRLLKEATTPVTLVVTDPDTNRYRITYYTMNVFPQSVVKIQKILLTIPMNSRVKAGSKCMIFDAH